MPCDQMPTADRTRLAIIEEETCGTTPDTPELQLFGMTAESLSENLGFTTSSEINADRNIKDSVNTSVEPGGALNVEWRINALIPLIVAALQTDTVVIVNEAALITVDATDPAAVIFTAATAIYGAMEEGYFIKNAGFVAPGNNGLYRITTVTSTTVIVAAPVEGQTPVDVTDDPAAAFSHSNSTNGTTTRSFTVQKSFDDMETPAYFKYRGCQFTTMALNFATGSIVTGSFGVLGMNLNPDFEEDTGSTYLPSSDDPILDAVNSIGAIRIDGEEETSPTTAITIDVNNESRGQTAIGFPGFVGIAHGRCNVTGTLTAYFRTISQYERFKSGATSTVDILLEDSIGNQLVITLPRIKITALNPVAGGTGTDVMAAGTYQALKEDGQPVTIRITQFDIPTP